MWGLLGVWGQSLCGQGVCVRLTGWRALLALCRPTPSSACRHHRPPCSACAVQADTIIRLRDGAISIRVTEVAAGRVVKGVVLNSGSLFERRVVHISGVRLHASPMANLRDMQVRCGGACAAPVVCYVRKRARGLVGS